MVPSIEKENGLLELATQSKQRKYHAEVTSVPRHNSYGDENNSESKKEIMKRATIEKLSVRHVDYDLSENCSYKVIEGPIDLSSSNSLKIVTERGPTDTAITVKVEDNIVDERKFMLQKNKQKKRKTTMFVDEEWAIEQMSERIPKQTVSKKEEVLKAARSLFSKRTRTLYHWMYPDTSKGKLKAIVSSAWDTLSTTEKEFYVSQVLGRFGVPAGSLMVNPQLGGFQNRDISTTASVGLLASTSNMTSNNLDITASSTFHNRDDSSGMWARKRWRRHVNNEDYASRLPHQNSSTVEVVDPDYDEDEFADDPELTTELLQFQRAMGNTE